MYAFHSQEPLATEKTCVTYLLHHMVDYLNITNQSTFGRRHFETPRDRTQSGERGIKKGCMDFLSTTQQLNHRLSRSRQHLTTNRVGVGGRKNTFALSFSAQKHQTHALLQNASNAVRGSQGKSALQH